jgi:ubiquinone/menaquinone biosynthesis C-methylase UbiE
MRALIQKILYVPVIKAKANQVGPYILTYSKGSKNYLDVGCGDGVVSHYIRKTVGNHNFMGLDVLDLRLIDIPLTLYDGVHFPFPDDSFDTVYAIFCLHHCNDEKQILKEMLRVARKKVIFIEEIYTSQLDQLYLYVHDWIGNRMESFFINISNHFHTDDEWHTIVKNLSYSITQEKRIFQFPFWLSVLLLTFTKQKLYVITKEKKR